MRTPVVVPTIRADCSPELREARGELLAAIADWERTAAQYDADVMLASSLSVEEFDEVAPTLRLQGRAAELSAREVELRQGVVTFTGHYRAELQRLLEAATADFETAQAAVSGKLTDIGYQDVLAVCVLTHPDVQAARRRQWLLKAELAKFDT